MISISRAAIRQAHSQINPVFLNRPQFELDSLNRILKTRLVLKAETLNPIRSVKGRGADYFVQQAHDSALVCASAGNFGQALLYPERFAGQLLATPLCGSNLTEQQIAQWLV